MTPRMMLKTYNGICLVNTELGVQDMRKPGILIKNAEMSQEQREMLADLLDNMSESNIFRAMEYILGDNFLKFLDAFQGDRIEFPTIEEIERRIERVKIYSDWKRMKNEKAVAVKWKRNLAWIERVLSDTAQELEDSESEHL